MAVRDTTPERILADVWPAILNGRSPRDLDDGGDVPSWLFGCLHLFLTLRAPEPSADESAALAAECVAIRDALQRPREVGEWDRADLAVTIAGVDATYEAAAEWTPEAVEAFNASRPEDFRCQSLRNADGCIAIEGMGRALRRVLRAYTGFRLEEHRLADFYAVPGAALMVTDTPPDAAYSAAFMLPFTGELAWRNAALAAGAHASPEKGLALRARWLAALRAALEKPMDAVEYLARQTLGRAALVAHRALQAVAEEEQFGSADIPQLYSDLVFPRHCKWVRDGFRLHGLTVEPAAVLRAEGRAAVALAQAARPFPPLERASREETERTGRKFRGRVAPLLDIDSDAEERIFAVLHGEIRDAVRAASAGVGSC